MIRKFTCREIAFFVWSSGAGSLGGVPLAVSPRNGTKLVYLSMYASRVTIKDTRE
jgi:hypothetical protein